MTDRELLEAAAKAAGFWDKEFQCFVGPASWDPLVNDSDALRLAVQLDLLGMPLLAHYTSLERLSGHDKHIATRRAIVRAAAGIARRTEKQ